MAYYKNVIKLISRNEIITSIFGTRAASRGERHGGAGARSISLSGADFNFTVEEMLHKWHARFVKEGVSEPLESIANILAHNLNSNRIGDVYANRAKILSDRQIANITAMCDKRVQNMPVQYIIGEWQFREITLKLRPPVFIPRPETEILVEMALNDIKSRQTNRILELCCGSGAISLALLNHRPNLHAVAVDISEEACELTKENARILGLDERITVHKDSVEGVTASSLLKGEKFDVIISNPPYVLSKDMKGLQPEILMYEDLDALDGGRDGLNIVKQIFNVAARFLNPAGKLFLEVDPSHPQLIPTLLLDAANKHLGLRFVAAQSDLSNETRFVEIIKNVVE